MKPALLILALYSSSALSIAAGLYKWVDDKGAVHYSDNPPAVSQNAGVSRLSRDAQVVQAAESVTDKAARLAAEQQKKQQQAQLREQQRADRALLERFHSPQEIDAERDRQLQEMAPGLATLNRQQQAATQRLSQLQAEARAHPAMPDGLASQISEQQQLLGGIREQLKLRQDDMARLRARAEQDSRRLRELQATAP